MPSFGMWRRVALVRTNVSEELIHSIIRVARIGDFCYPDYWKWCIPLKRWFFLEPHGVTFQQTSFFIIDFVKADILCLSSSVVILCLRNHFVAWGMCSLVRPIVSYPPRPCTAGPYVDIQQFRPFRSHRTVSLFAPSSTRMAWWLRWLTWNYTRFEGFTAVTMKNVVFWDIRTQFVLHRRHITCPLQSPAS
jgi:hypothetical protein